jgi:hypothetical protein
VPQHVDATRPLLLWRPHVRLRLGRHHGRHDRKRECGNLET